MDIHSIDPPWPVKVFAWFVVTWPFVAAALMRSRARSAAPLVAMVVPIAVATACAFASLGLVLEDLSITGAAPHVAAPGVRMARSLIRNGVLNAVLVAIAAMLRHHAPALDRVFVMLAALLTIEIGVALWIGATIASAQWQLGASSAGMAAAALTAAAAIVRLILLRVRAVPSPAAATP